jgi:hypothetical protein
MKLVKDRNTKAELFCFKIEYIKYQKEELKIMSHSRKEAYEIVKGMKEVHEILNVKKIKR